MKNELFTTLLTKKHVKKYVHLLFFIGEFRGVFFANRTKIIAEQHLCIVRFALIFDLQNIFVTPLLLWINTVFLIKFTDEAHRAYSILGLNVKLAYYICRRTSLPFYRPSPNC